MAAPYWFGKIAKRAQVYGAVKGKKEAESRAWFREQASRVHQVSTDRLMTETPSRLFRNMNTSDEGSLVFFYYDAKTKDQLPYWDRFPLVFPFDDQGDRFLGLNMHYLPPVLRAKLMDALYSKAIVDEKGKISRLKFDYYTDLVGQMARLWKPCIKCYLKSHVRSKFFFVAPKEWDMALFLPAERFQKATKEEVWTDSRRIIAGKKPR